jgi:hypothetical protein
VIYDVARGGSGLDDASWITKDMSALSGLRFSDSLGFLLRLGILFPFLHEAAFYSGMTMA